MRIFLRRADFERRAHYCPHYCPTEAAYLNDLLSLGVAGFRLDAAKSMRPENIQAIIDRLDSKPLLSQEVNSDSSQPVTANMYSTVRSDSSLHP